MEHTDLHTSYEKSVFILHICGKNSNIPTLIE